MWELPAGCVREFLPKPETVNYALGTAVVRKMGNSALLLRPFIKSWLNLYPKKLM